MSKKKHEEAVEEEVAPFWMISFSDLMTLLLSFFIILFSISTIEKEKMVSLMEAMGDRYLATPREKKVAPVQEKKASSLREKIHDNLQSLGSNPEGTENVEPLVVEKTDQPTTKGTIIPFKLEETDVNDEDKDVLHRLVADSLLDSKGTILVRGHSSNKEQSRSVVDDLAYERAWNVRKHLETLGIPPERCLLVIVGPREPVSHELLSDHFGDVNTYVNVILQEHP